MLLILLFFTTNANAASLDQLSMNGTLKSFNEHSVTLASDKRLIVVPRQLIEKKNIHPEETLTIQFQRKDISSFKSYPLK